MNESLAEFSLEQKLELRKFELQVEKMSREQAQEFLIKLFEQMMIQEVMYKRFIAQQWGFE